MSDDAQSSRQPRCASCGGELVEEDLSGLWRPVGLLLLAAAVLIMPAWPFRTPSEVAWVVAAVTAVVGLVLMRGRMRWRCVECDAAFKRRLPPRAQRTDEQQAEESPLAEDAEPFDDEDQDD